MSVRVVACVTSRVLVDDVPGVWLVELVAGVLGDGSAFGSSGYGMLSSFANRVGQSLEIALEISLVLALFSV